MPADGETLDQKWTRDGQEPRADRPVPGLLLVFTGGRPALKPLPVGEQPLLLGRGLVGDVEIDDACMSRRHAEVSRSGGVWAIRDLDSRNGTALDGKAVAGEVVSASARVLRVGDTLLLLCVDLRPLAEADVEVCGDVVVGPTLRRAWNLIDGIARSSEVLHVTGETGSGKEIAARRFHAQSPRPNGPFVAVNCATIPAALAERLLFGARRGAYSGADADSEGFVQAADGGTLLLDEVAELDPAVQAKLLRVLESREVTPLGAAKPRKVDLRLCSATHGQLRDRVDEGRFREDLYFRIGRPHVALPPLRERAEDIPWLVQQLLADRAPMRPHVSLVETALARPWPGNVRELALEIREAARLAATGGAEQVEARHLDRRAGLGRAAADESAAPRSAPSTAASRQARTRAPASAPPGREEVEAALRQSGGNVSRAAQALGVHRTQLRRWVQRYDIDPRRFTPDASPSEPDEG